MATQTLAARIAALEALVASLSATKVAEPTRNVSTFPGYTAARKAALGGECRCGKTFAFAKGLSFHQGWCKKA